MKKILLCITTIVSILALPFSCLANDDGTKGNGAEKTLTAELKKDYTAAKFNIKFDEEGSYGITITEPDGSSIHDTPMTSGTEASCVVKEPPKGVWTIHITKEPEKYTDENGEEKTKDATPIGGVHVEIQGSTQEMTETENDIKVAADISGLKMYFRDNTFVAEWAESNRGSMYIEVVDAKTQEKLASDTSEGYSFELDVDPHLHDNIVVTIVPEESSKVDNAERRWTLTTKNEPDASYSFPKEKMINWETVPVTATFGLPYKVVAYLNNRIIAETDVFEAGSHDIELDTEVGENSYLIYTVDPGTGYMKSVEFDIIKDVVAPAIKLDQSYENISTDDENIVFEGSIDPDYKTFTINDNEIKVEGDHTFKYEYALKEGANNIKIRATDEAGNASEYSTIITRIVPEVAKVPWAPIIIGCSLAGLAATYIVMMFVKRRRQSYEEDDDNDEDDDDDDDDIPPSRHKKSSPKNTTKPKNKKRRVMNPKLSFALRILIPVGCVFAIVHYLISLTTVASGSMLPKLTVGNLAVYNRLAYKKAEPQRGDIILFHSDEMNINMAKRVIGIPGDTIQFIDGYVFINGQRADESEYISANIETNSADTFTVPEKSVFVMGDNREDSYDSRCFEQPYIPYDNIIGKFMGQSGFNIRYAIEQQMKEDNEVKAAEPEE